MNLDVIFFQKCICVYLQTSYVSRTLGGNRIVDHSDVVGAAPTGDAPTTSEWSATFSFPNLALKGVSLGEQSIDNCPAF